MPKGDGSRVLGVSVLHTFLILVRPEATVPIVTKRVVSSGHKCSSFEDGTRVEDCARMRGSIISAVRERCGEKCLKRQNLAALRPMVRGRCHTRLPSTSTSYQHKSKLDPIGIIFCCCCGKSTFGIPWGRPIIVRVEPRQHPFYPRPTRPILCAFGSDRRDRSLFPFNLKNMKY